MQKLTLLDRVVAEDTLLTVPRFVTQHDGLDDPLHLLHGLLNLDEVDPVAPHLDLGVQAALVIEPALVHLDIVPSFVEEDVVNLAGLVEVVLEEAALLVPNVPSAQVPAGHIEAAHLALPDWLEVVI